MEKEYDSILSHMSNMAECNRIMIAFHRFQTEGKESQYTAANVCIVPGGRAGITRIMAVLGETQVGFLNPDYTAYEVRYMLHVSCHCNHTSCNSKRFRFNVMYVLGVAGE